MKVDTISNGYEVISIRTIIESVIDAEEKVTVKATTAMVSLENREAGFATVKLDVELEPNKLIELVSKQH